MHFKLIIGCRREQLLRQHLFAPDALFQVLGILKYIVSSRLFDMEHRQIGLFDEIVGVIPVLGINADAYAGCAIEEMPLNLMRHGESVLNA
ncbi:hypothetical protein D3C74_412810 [compost metagenome]